MRLLSICLFAIFGILAVSSLIPRWADISKRSLSAPEKRDVNLFALEKRKGGGSKGGGSSSSSGSSSSGSSSSGSGGKTTGSSAGASSSSNRGGTSSGGSGAPRSYGGGKYYGGGATTPYSAGARTPRGIGAGPLLGIGALGFFGGAWLYGAYLYSYPHSYGFYNRTANLNQTKPVNCLCQQYSVCGCDDNDDTTYLSSIIGDGSPSSMNQSLIRVADVNGTSQIFINGTLPNGTTADGADDTSPAVMKLPPVVNACLLAFAIGSALLAL